MLSVEAIEKDFFIDGEDKPPLHVKQVAVSGWAQVEQVVWLDPDEADQLVDKLITVLYDVGYYDDPFAGPVAKTQEED